MSNKNRNLKKIISTLCAMAALGGSASAKDVTVKPVNKKNSSFASDIINKIKRNPGKSAVIGTGVVAGLGLTGYGIKKTFFDKNKENKNKEQQASQASNASINTNTNEQSVAQPNSNEMQQLQAVNAQLEQQLRSEQRASNVKLLVNNKLDTNKSVIAMRRGFGDSQNSRFSSRDWYISQKLNGLGFQNENLKLDATNCTVFDLANNNYSLYVFDFNGKIPDGAKDLVKPFPGVENMYYTLGRGKVLKGSYLVNPSDYNVTISKSSNSKAGSLAYNFAVDMAKL